MDIDDLLIEVRNSSLERLGAILKDDLQLEAEIPFNGVGTWSVTISLEHPLAAELSSPGGGIVATNLVTGEVMFSGPAVQPEQARSTENLAGFITVQGVTDEIVLDDALAWPDPSSGDAAGQVAVQDERSGTAEAVMHGFVSSNIGLLAPSNRRNPRLFAGEMENRGGVVTQTARFDKLLTLCQNLATPDGLGFRIRQTGSRLKFETFMPRDQRRLVRLSLENDGIANSRVAQSAPTLTRALVVGTPGAVLGSTQTIAEVTTPESLEAETQWGRRIESFVDQQDTRNDDVLVRAGQEALKEGGFTSTNARFEPTETFRAAYGHEWDLGDTVTVESGDRTFTAPVTAMIFKVDADSGFRLGAILGDPTTFNDVARLSAAIQAVSAAPGVTRPPTDTTPLNDALAELDEALAANDLALAANEAALAQLDLDLAANDLALAALDEALAANDLALEQIGTTANGKNAVTYQTFAPTTQANKAGDIWYVRNATTGVVSAQYEGLGGTSWRSVTLTNVVVSSLDAGAITSGTINAARIAATQINASNITTGTLNAGGIAVTNLNAGSITTGTLNCGLLTVTNINAGSIVTGTLNCGLLTVTNLSASSITTGTLSASRISGGTLSGVRVVSGGGAWALDNDSLIGNSGGLPTISFYSTGYGSMKGLVLSETLQAGGEISGATLLTSSPPEAGATDGYAVRLGSSGRINKVTSSRRYKTDETDAALDVDAALQLQPKRYTRIATGRSEIGFVAEDAEALGLDDWVLRNEDGSVESFAYDAWCIALQAIVRQQAEQIAELKAAVADLAA